jgi:hypothetical protein
MPRKYMVWDFTNATDEQLEKWANDPNCRSREGAKRRLEMRRGVQESPAENPNAGKRAWAYRNTVIVACLWFVFDALLINLPFFSFFWLALVVPVLVVLWVWGRVRERLKKPTNWRMKAAKVLIITLASMCVVLSLALNNAMADRRMERVAAACEQFNAKYHRYPHTLEELVPEFLPSVPLAKYVLNQWSSFAYSEEWHWLMYYQRPPFGRKFYTLGTKEVWYLD